MTTHRRPNVKHEELGLLTAVLELLTLRGCDFTVQPIPRVCTTPRFYPRLCFEHIAPDAVRLLGLPLRTRTCIHVVILEYEACIRAMDLLSDLDQLIRFEETPVVLECLHIEHRHFQPILVVCVAALRSEEH